MKKKYHVLKRERQNDQSHELHAQRIVRFSEFLSKPEICQLDSIGLSQDRDSPYIRSCITSLYKQDLSILKRKSLRGKPYVDRSSLERQENKILTPEKVRVIHELFTERVILSKENIDKRIDISYINRKITNILSSLKRTAE